MRNIFLILLAINLYGGVFDFFYIKDAKEAYKNKEYSKSIDDYKKLLKTNSSDEIRYNLANSYYKAHNYKKAKELYSSIKSQSLQFDKLHNLGNTNAKLGKIDEAIKNYEDALKIKDDKDTKYNLELLKKQKKEQQQKKNNKNNKKNDQNKKDKKQKNNDKKNKENKKQQNKDQKNKSGKNNQNKEKKKKDTKDGKKNNNTKDRKKEQDKKNMKDNKNNRKKEKDKDNLKKANMKQQNLKKGNKKRKVVPISDLEENRYKKMLNNRGINTLLLPLNTKGDNNEQIKPW